MEEVKLKEFSPEEIRRLAGKIRVVMRFKKRKDEFTESEKGHLYFLKPTDPEVTVFTGQPIPEKRATGLKKLATIDTFHARCIRAPKPTVAEVLVCIPPEHLNRVVAFEFFTIDDNFPVNDNDKYVKGQAILYTKAKAASHN